MMYSLQCYDSIMQNDSFNHTLYILYPQLGICFHVDNQSHICNIAYCVSLYFVCPNVLV